MYRKEFERVTPESVGIPSASIENLLDKLEEGWTEPHGLMIMRDGKVCAEGWWAPYAPDIIHGLQSHTKTYAATEVGIAYTEGILKLDERLIDIFPDEAPENPSENLKKLTVRDVLCMGCGMETMPRGSVDWVKDFLAVPVVHEPGTRFMYNSTGSSILCAIVKKKTGLGMIDYLRPRLFDKIGIDADNLKCMCMPDGTEMGGGGLYATTEDNLRLMKLYADGGVWEGERILAEDYVKLATSLQNESATERAVNPPAEDNFVGYGFQIWMCRPQGVYRADGAMGQFTIVFPRYNMILAITECAAGSTGGVMPQKTLDTIWDWYYSLPSPSVGSMIENKAASDHLARRMSMLALPSPGRSPFCKEAPKYQGTYEVDGKFSFRSRGFLMPAGNGDEDLKTIGFKFNPTNIEITGVRNDGKVQAIVAATDGSREKNIVDGLANIALVSAKWISDSELKLDFRMIETTGGTEYTFRFGETAEIEMPGNRFFSAGKPIIIPLKKI